MRYQFKKKLHTFLSISFLLVALLIIAAVIITLNAVGKPLLQKENDRLIEQFGFKIVSDLGNKIAMAESLTASLANAGECLPHDDAIYMKVIPKIINREGYESIVAGGGIWPEPYMFHPDLERRSFFWGREPNGVLKYYNQYNSADGKGYHHEEWYVPSRFTQEGTCFWSKSYMDPYSYQPMVTCTVPLRNGDTLLGVSTIDLKLDGLEAFFENAIKGTGGYVFATDRNNKFLSFPDDSLTKIFSTDENGKDTQEFIYADDFGKKEPRFAPISRALETINDDIIRAAHSIPGFNPQLPQIIANDSYQITIEEARIIAAIMVDPLRHLTSGSNKLKTLRLKDDCILHEETIVTIFHMPATYWKIVLVTPYQKSAAVVDTISSKMILSLLLIITIPMTLIFFVLRKQLLIPLKTITKYLQDLEVETSDLTLMMKVPSKNELGELVYWYNSRSEELRKTKNYLNKIINSMPSILIGIDREYQVTSWNRKAQEITGIPLLKARGLHIKDVCPQLEDHIYMIAKAFQELKPQAESKVPLYFKGILLYIDITIFPLKWDKDEGEGAVIQMDDVSTQMRMEELMIQSEKMMSVGGLAAGMAHEINNPLAGILQNMQVIHNRVNPDHPKNKQAAEDCNTTIDAVYNYMEHRDILGMIDSVMESSRRAAKIIENMLNFSRKSDSKFAHHDLEELLEQTVELASKDYDFKKKYDFRRIQIIRQYQEDMPQVPCEGMKIQQVFFNLLKNAAQAMYDNPDKQIPPCFIFRIKCEEDMARIEISDNGPGMDEETRKRVFEPFFTTKGKGVGTGLGLSVSYFIITNNHNGTMTVESSPGKGTNFIIQLPLEAKDKRNR